MLFFLCVYQLFVVPLQSKTTSLVAITPTYRNHALNYLYHLSN